MIKGNSSSLLVPVLAVTLSAGFATASTISSVSPGSGQASLAAANGTSYSIMLGSYSVDGNGMTGISITAGFAGGATSTCTWGTVSNNTCSKSSGNLFTVSFGATTDTDPAALGDSVAAAIWTITNNNSGAALSSITINALAGNIDFDLCTTKVGAAAIQIDNTDQSGGDCNGTNANDGTVGSGGATSNVGYSAHTATGTGTAAATGAAIYSNELHLASAAPIGDIWGTLTLNFTGGFANGQTFTFGADTDHVSAVTADTSPVPEPATFGLVGMALAGLGALRISQRKSKV